jgi:hypothetical protein
MATWREHFDTWHLLSKTDLRPIQEEGSILAGRDAEDLLRNLVDENYSFKGCHSFAGKRIPNLDGKGRREIDLVVITAKKIYVIECKNWSGELILHQDRWVQVKTDKNRQVERTHENIWQLNQFKMNLLVRNLANSGIQIRSQDICQKIIFMNKNLKIIDPHRYSYPDIITADRLDTYLAQQNNRLKPHERLFSSVIGLLLDEEIQDKIVDGIGIDRVGGDRHQQVIQTVSKFGTWDKVCLHGTKILSGDIYYHTPIDIFCVPPRFQNIKTIRVKFVRNKWLGLLKALFKIGRPITLELYDVAGKLIDRVEGNPHGIVRMIPAGSPTPIDTSILQVDRIVYGKYLEPLQRSISPRFSFKKILGIGLLAFLFSKFVAPNLGSTIDWVQSLGMNAEAERLNSYRGKYDFGKFAIEINRKNDRLNLDMGNGKVELQKTTTDREFISRKGDRYRFIITNGKVSHLVWIGKNNKLRRGAKVKR